MFQTGGLIYTFSEFSLGKLYAMGRDDKYKITCENGFSDSCTSDYPVFASKRTDKFIPIFISYFMAWSFLQENIKDLSRISVLLSDVLLSDKYKKNIKKKSMCCLVIGLLQSFALIATVENIINFSFSAGNPVDIFTVGIGFIILNESDNKVYSAIKDKNCLSKGIVCQIDAIKASKLFFKDRSRILLYDFVASTALLTHFFGVYNTEQSIL